MLFLILVGLLAAGGYTAYAGNGVYQNLDSGRQQLVAAQSAIKVAGRSGDAAQLQSADAELRKAEQDFTNADHQARQDPALRVAGGLPGTGRQLDATAHLAAIGADLSRAGQGAATVAIQLAALKQQYAGRPLTADDLRALLQQAQAIATTYKASISSIGEQLKAAHDERARVTTTDLLPQLQHAYDDVDQALTSADTAFLRYQDVRGVLSDLLGTQLPA
ncbi:MAG TPA: hypothetical protein VFR68_09695 [Candidatus Dormibacteraeota bacterium]|nr:hypothetical protein [Candidatus Dormibacteraeota bacterium]